MHTAWMTASTSSSLYPDVAIHMMFILSNTFAKFYFFFFKDYFLYFIHISCNNSFVILAAQNRIKKRINFIFIYGSFIVVWGHKDKNTLISDTLALFRKNHGLSCLIPAGWTSATF